MAAAELAGAGFVPGRAGLTCSEVELTLSCRNLRNMDLFSKSDPMVVVSQQLPSGVWSSIGRTEMILNNLNPDFATKIVLEYHFEAIQQLKFDVYDIDSDNLEKLDEHDFLGSCTSSLGHIVSSGNVAIALRGTTEKSGKLLIVAEELSTNKDEVIMQFGARNLIKKWWAWPNGPDTYIELHKVDEHCGHSLVFRSEIQNGSTAPKWKPITLPVRSVCGGDFDRSIRIRCFSKRSFAEARLIGETSFTLKQLNEPSGASEDFPLMNAKKPNVVVGEIYLANFKIKKVYSFLEFVLGGMQIHCTVAIDFTASNGDPTDPQSLHFIDPTKPNQYEQALRAVVDILQDYNSGKQFPVLGFGAKVPPRGLVNHAFYVNFRDNPFCSGVQGVMDAYQCCIREIQLFGPTNFSPVISHVAQYARAYQDGSQYFILLIVTDGVITDMLQTKKAIIEASSLPLSIIIVGVGGANFEAMSELDGDDVRLSIPGFKASRDIVQFVPFREFQSNSNPIETRRRLAKEVLAEIPSQVVGFMESRHIVPREDPPPPYSETNPPATT